tara:strand:+ start:146 stop:346 length:201 start_codon:yes stop_codon:yes gene_type:complete
MIRLSINAYFMYEKNSPRYFMKPIFGLIIFAIKTGYPIIKPVEFIGELVYAAYNSYLSDLQRLICP